MRYFIFTIIFLSFLWAGANGRAETFRTLSQMEQLLVSSNARLAVLSANAQLRLASIKKEASFDDLMAGIEWRGSVRTAFLAQRLPFWGKLNDLEKIAAAEAQMAQLQFLEAKNSVVNQAFKLMVQQRLQEKEIAVIGQQVDQFEQTLKSFSAQVSTGKGRTADLYELKLQKINFQKQLIDARQARFETQQNLQQLFQTQDEIEMTIPVPDFSILSTSSNAIEKELLLKNYAWQIKQAEFQRSFWQLEWARKSYFPDLQVKAGAMETPGMPNEFMAELSINVPWFNARNDGAVEAAQYFELMQKNDLEVLRRELEARARILFSQLNFLNQKLELARQELALAKLRYESIKNLYQTDQADIGEFNQAKIEQMNIALGVIALEKQHAEVYFDLLTLTGSQIKEAL